MEQFLHLHHQKHQRLHRQRMSIMDQCVIIIQMNPLQPQCARCGKYVCKDCAKAYTVAIGEYANKTLCYDCCEQIVSNNISELTANKNIVKGQFVLQIIGMVIGFILGMSSGISSGDIGSGFIAGLIYACIGGVFLSAIKAFFSLVGIVLKLHLQVNSAG